MKKIKDVTMEEAVGVFKSITGEDVSTDELKETEMFLKEENKTMGDHLYENFIEENIKNVDEIRKFFNVIFEFEKIGVDVVSEIKEIMNG